MEKMLKEIRSTRQNYNEIYAQEASRLSKITDETLVSLISCNGFEERFGAPKLRLYPKAITHNIANGGYLYEEKGYITDRNQNQFSVQIARDLDNAGVKIKSDDDSTILYLNLRDRRMDGSAYASAPKYLRESAGISAIPDRSYFLGGTNWNYSMPIDQQPPGTHALEISIVSSDPTKRIHPKLEPKNHKLWVDAHTLSNFIDDPFDAIPFEDPSPQALSKWYLLWWQVVNRGLRGKTIPFPGQVSERGFEGFLNHVVTTTSKAAKELGYTHISAVPTWIYVLHMFEDRGFGFDDEETKQQTEKFIRALDTIIIPHDLRRNHQMTLGDLPKKHPLKSWFAVLPFVLRLNSEIKPSFPIPQEYQEVFEEVLEAAKHAFCTQEGILSYPLEPDNNIWLSKPV